MTHGAPYVFFNTPLLFCAFYCPCIDLEQALRTSQTLWIKQAVFSVTDKFIRNAPFSLEGTVIFGNHCYSGYTANGTTWNLADAYHSKGAVAYYGYAYPDNSSGAVQNDVANSMEDTLIRSLAKDGDTTGIAHLKNNSTIQWSRGVEASDAFPVLANRGGLVFKPVEHDPNDELRFVLFYEENYGYGCGDTITDSRDGQQYATVCIGEQVWMAKNLNWNGAGVCYDNNSANCNTYGRLYSITELTGLDTSNANPGTVKGLCPDGWHVPSKAEFEELIAFCGGETQAADKLRSASGWPSAHSNSTGFDLKPAGHYTTSATNSLFRNIGQDAKMWTSAQSGSDMYYAVNAYHPNFSLGPYSTIITGQEWYFSCRCVKD